MQNTLEHLYDLLGQAVLLEIPLGKKGPRLPAWQKITFADTQTSAYQSELSGCVKRGGNIGVLLGPASGRLVAVDVDNDDLSQVFLTLNPWLGDTLRSHGKRGCQFWMRIKPGTTYPNNQSNYVLKTAEGKKYGEWRCGGGDRGAQSIIYGKHPEGPTYEILVDRRPLEVDFANIKWPAPWDEPTPAQPPPPTQAGGVTPVASVQDKNRFRRKLCDVKQPIQYGDALDSQFSALLGQHLAPYGFFERSARCVELEYDYKLGAFQLTPADPYGFCTDLETVCSPFFMKEVTNKKTGEKDFVRRFRSIPLILSRTVLASKDFLEQLRPLLGFAAMRVPVRRSSNEIELLAEGYDEQSGILTVSTPSADYGLAAGDFTLASAGNYFRELLSEFCFYEEDKDRAASVVLSGMLTLFCRELLGPRTQKPAFIYSANSEGAGKTLLAKLAIISHLGYCPTGTVPDDEDEFRKRIFSNTLADMPVLFLDNVKGYLSSGALEAFLTSSIVSDRVLGASRVLNLEHNSVVFITGNAATYSADLRRRSLTIELFLQEMKSEDRPILHPLDDPGINDKRTEILAALWTLVDSWIEAGEPKPALYHPSFRRWSEVIAGILEHAGFASPCTDPFTELSGDQDTKDMTKLVNQMNPGYQFKYDELVKYCQDYGLFPGIVPDKGDQDPAQRSRFGKLLRRYRDRVLNKTLKFQILGHSRDTQRFVVQSLS